MTLQIYNTMTRRKETFVPVHPDKVNMYVCGPTVYDYIHIGNARPQIVFDVVRRYLEQIGYEVNYVVNFTDVDDRLIRKSIETGDPVPVIAERFIQAFYEDIDGLGVRRATHNPRVLDHIEEIIAFIANLVEEGYAYESGKDVYFRTNRFKEYGKLSHQNLEELQHGIRVEVDERKENPEDFVLWKAAKPERSPGRAHGARAVRGGISNAPPWRANFWAIRWIFTAEARICSSRITSAKWRNPNR